MSLKGDATEPTPHVAAVVGPDHLVKIDDGQSVHVRTAGEWLELARADLQRRSAGGVERAAIEKALLYVEGGMRAATAFAPNLMGDFSAIKQELDKALRVSAITASPVDEEVARAVAKFPTWPTDPLHALAVLGEEFGELTKAMLQLTYEPHKTSAEEVRTEALQTAAMALRLFRSLERYEYRPSEQHEQLATDSRQR